MREVFISYSTKDKTWADAACAVLEGRKVRCWIAPRDITPGTEWGAAITSGIDACKIMVLIFSANANASAQVRREVELAISKGMAVLPFRVENVLPLGAMKYALSNTHWLDAFTPPVERQTTMLAESVQALLAKHRESSEVDTADAAAPRVASPAARRWRWWVLAIVAAVLLLVGSVLAGIALTFKTNDAIVRLQVDPPDAVVVAEDGKIIVTRNAEEEPYTIAVADGGGRVRISKPGFTAEHREVTLNDKGTTITVKLQPAPALPPEVLPVSKKEPAPKVPAVAANNGFVPLFNGKDLTGWKRQGTNAMDWTFTEGLLVGKNKLKKGSPPPTLGSVTTDRTDYANFHLRCETMTSGGMDSFIQFRTSSDSKPGDKEAYRVLIGAPGALHVHNNGIRGTQILFKDASNVQLKADDWFRLEIIAQGTLIQVLNNGTRVVEYVDAQNPLLRGSSISFSCARGCTLRIRKLEIKELNP